MLEFTVHSQHIFTSSSFNINGLRSMLCLQRVCGATRQAAFKEATPTETFTLSETSMSSIWYLFLSHNQNHHRPISQKAL